MTARSKTWVYFSFLVGIAAWCSNPAVGVDVWFECCQVEVSATGRSFLQMSPTDCGALDWVSPLKLVEKEAQVHYDCRAGRGGGGSWLWYIILFVIGGVW